MHNATIRHKILTIPGLHNSGPTHWQSLWERKFEDAERIELRGFGVFVVKPRKRGVGRNPRTGKEVPIPAGKTIRFKPGKELSAKAVG